MTENPFIARTLDTRVLHTASHRDTTTATRTIQTAEKEKKEDSQISAFETHKAVRLLSLLLLLLMAQCPNDWTPRIALQRVMRGDAADESEAPA